MSLKQRFAREGIEWRQVEHDDRTELVTDLGPAGPSSVDVVGDTVIVVGSDDQYEFEVPDGARASMSNGVLTIEVSR